MEKEYKKFVTDKTIDFVYEILTDAFDFTFDDLVSHYVPNKDFRTIRHKKWLVIANSGLPFNRELWYTENDTITIEDMVQIAKAATAMKINSVPMWLVVRDYQGGGFGTGRLYTRKEWEEQDYDWALASADVEKEQFFNSYKGMSDEDFFRNLESLYEIEFERWDDSERQREILNNSEL